MKLKFLAALTAVCTISLLPLFSESEISEYAETKLKEFVDYRIILKSEPDEKALEEIIKFEEETFAELEANAKDYDQEFALFKGLFYMEKYEHMFSPDKRAELRKDCKSIMKSLHKVIDKRKEKEINKWTYVVAADVTNYYMTRSMAATLYYGFTVKDWYKCALKKDKYFTIANTDLATWNYYAPGPFGSNKKAKELYKNGVKGTEREDCTDGEKYMVYEYFSQFLYEQKDKTGAAEYLQKCYDLNMGTKELDLIKNLNENKKISFLEYLRNRSGIDEEMPDSEKDEEDK